MTVAVSAQFARDATVSNQKPRGVEPRPGGVERKSRWRKVRVPVNGSMTTCQIAAHDDEGMNSDRRRGKVDYDGSRPRIVDVLKHVPGLTAALLL